MVLSVTKRVSQGIWLWQYRRGVLDAPTVMYLNMLTEELLASFWGYAGLLERIYDGLEPTRILVQLLREKPALLDNGAAAQVAVPSQVGIRMVDVGFTYSRGNKVIRNLNLSIKEGKITGLVGRSGCGKTPYTACFPECSTFSREVSWCAARMCASGRSSNSAAYSRSCRNPAVCSFRIPRCWT